jgi:DNA-binding transcriptional ArsR family regulator
MQIEMMEYWIVRSLSNKILLMRRSHFPSLKKIPLSAILYALSDPARLKIVKYLLDESEVACGDFKCTVSKSTMSHHFKVLRESGLIQNRCEGTKQLNTLRSAEIEARFPGLLKAIAKADGPY